MKPYLFSFVILSLLTMPNYSHVYAEALTNTEATVSEASVKENVELPQLSLEQAVKWAVDYSYDVKIADQGIERSDIKMESASDDLDYIPIGIGNGEDDSSIRSTLKNVTSSNIDYQMANKEAEVAKDQVSFSVKKAYQDVLLKEMNLENSKESLELAQIEEKTALAKAARGKVSKVEKEKIIQARVEAEKNFQIVKAQLQDAFVNLNSMMGKAAEQYYVLIDKPTYTNSTITDINTHINRIFDSNPSIWLLEKKIELAKLDLTLFSYNAGQSYDLEELDVDQAVLTLASSKELLETSIRDMYSNLQQLEENYQILTSSLTTVKEDLRVAQVKLSKGLVTTADVTKASISINQKQREIDQILIQMDQLHDTLAKPWIN